MGDKNILHIIDSLNLGGAERLLVNVVNNMKGPSHHIICLSHNADLENELNKNVTLTKLGFRSKKDIFRSVRFIRKYIRKHNISVVHSHLVMSNILARLATPKNVKLINSLHNLNGLKFFSKRLSWQKIVEKWIYKKRHSIIAVSDEVLADFNKYIGIKGPAFVLHNFVDDKFFAEAPKHRGQTTGLRTIAVGSFKPQKNYNFLVEAFRQLSNSITIDIFGEGPLRNEIEQKIREYNLQNISICGIDRQLEKRIRQYDLYIMCSSAEGHPVALLEAMASGMPVMVSGIPVLKEATGNFSIYFDCSDTKDFINKITAIATRKIELDIYADYNLNFAKEVARKEDYLKKLFAIYTGISSRS